jgi:UTP--glucose-1-phosphate uridylyltransferase
VKALHPFAKLGGRHRSFIETHLAKSAATGKLSGAPVTHIFTTSYLTHGATEAALSAEKNFRYDGRVILSPGRSIGLRMVPTARDLRFAFEEMPHQQLDPQKEKVRASLHKALIDWAVNAGEASDYTDNLPGQCLHPVGHWYEVANLLLNGTLRELLTKQPQVEHLMLHNIDTLGANLDPVVFGRHILEGAAISVEVIRRRLEDRGGGLARVNGQLRLVEGLAMAREEDEFKLTYYNSATNWIHVDSLLEMFGVNRASIGDAAKVAAGVRALAAKMPSYVTLKDVKKRWGNGQEDIMPVAQFEKLWGDMTTLHDAEIRFFAVPRARGQQLKDQAQLDGWLRDGSAAGVERLCVFG